MLLPFDSPLPHLFFFRLSLGLLAHAQRMKPRRSRPRSAVMVMDDAEPMPLASSTPASHDASPTNADGRGRRRSSIAIADQENPLDSSPGVHTYLWDSPDAYTASAADAANPVQRFHGAVVYHDYQGQGNEGVGASSAMRARASVDGVPVSRSFSVNAAHPAPPLEASASAAQRAARLHATHAMVSSPEQSPIRDTRTRHATTNAPPSPARYDTIRPSPRDNAPAQTVSDGQPRVFYQSSVSSPSQRSPSSPHHSSPSRAQRSTMRGPQYPGSPASRRRTGGLQPASTTALPTPSNAEIVVQSHTPLRHGPLDMVEVEQSPIRAPDRNAVRAFNHRQSEQVAAAEMQYLQQELLKARRDLINMHTKLDIKDRKLSASLLSIKLFWAPELEKERRAKTMEKQRAEAAEILLREQEQRNGVYISRIQQFQRMFDDLQRGFNVSKADLADTKDVDADKPSSQKELQALRKELATTKRQLALLQAEADMTSLITGEAFDETQPAQSASTTADLEALHTAQEERNQLGNQLSLANLKLTDLQKEHARLKSTHSATLEDLEDAIALRDDLRQQLHERERQNQAQLDQMRRSTDEELDMLQQRLAEARDDVTAEATKRQTAETRLQDLEGDLEDARAEVARLQHQMAAVRLDHEQHANTAAAQATETSQEVQSLREELNAAEERLQEHQSALQAAKQQLAAAEATEKRQEATRTALEQQITDLQAAREQLAEQAAARQAQVDEVTVTCQHLESSVNELQTALETAQTRALERQAELEQLERQNSELLSRIEFIEHSSTSTRDEGAARLADVQRQLALAHTEVEQERKHAAELRQAVEEKAAALAAAQQQLVSLETDRASTERALLAKQEAAVTENAHLLKRLEAAEERIAQTRQEVEREAATRSNENNRAAEEKLTAARNDLKRARADIRHSSPSAYMQHKIAAKNLQAAQEEAHKLRSNIKNLETELGKVRDTLKSKVEQHRTASKNAQASQDNLNRRLTAAQREVEQAKQALRTAEKEMTTLKASATAQQASLVKSREHVKKLEGAKARLQKELEDKSDAVHSLEEDVARVQAELSARLASQETSQRSQQKQSGELDTLRARVCELQDKLIFERSERLLERVSDLDARIAQLEMAGATRHATEIGDLRRQREQDVQLLREQFEARQALAVSQQEAMHDTSREDENDSREKLENREVEAVRLRKYIDQLLGEILRQDEPVASAIMTGLPRLQQDDPLSTAQIYAMSETELRRMIKKRDEDNQQLEAYVDSLLQKIVEHKPSILEVMSFTGDAHS
ncbi:uncharacterized protein MONBRDRAFT_33287 [Monosiga brevicollis MX1]|uniref:FIP-RBD domain-containing protein n=1 Tax=Monosiga brevicollis TaxID=81824 RepID=A9V4K4_MONBE|nr:uncharacterized protein MONBRDRAFT_33287 [Monosiga brevicollis MX1]EDQ87469.1 predicted protein [Monosiga brevicollis MX1]|eukprot:XP_001747729.1 hypothetical protein [Monosiga brevicollis MX1]